MRTLCLAFALAALAIPVAGQTRADLKRELKSREAQASDPAALLDLAKWAREKGLLSDQKRLLNKILESDPNHEGAMNALGFVKYEGEWVKAADAAERKRKAMEAEYKARGMKKVDGVWVEKDHVADAKKGIFHHDGEVVSKSDKMALMDGMVRHPRTGRFIAAADEEKADNDLFPIDEGKWVGEEEANAYHADFTHPWVWRTYYADIVTTAPLKDFDSIKGVVDGVFAAVQPLFAGRLPGPSHRPVIIVCPSRDAYQQMGAQIGAEHSVYGAFIATADASLDAFEGVDFNARPAVANWGEQGWGEYYLRHASGLAYVQALADELDVELPYWLVCGVGSLAERHLVSAAHFAQQHIAKGGVKDLKDWFADFEISPNVPVIRVEYNVYQAGLVVSFGMFGGDAKVTEALQAWTGAFGKDGRAVLKAAQKFERLVMGKEDELREYLKTVIQKG